MDYDLELDQVIERIREENASKILIQVPEGLKTKAKEIIDTLKKGTGSEVVLDAENVYGACCIPREEERKEYDLIVHFAHTQMIPSKNVVYVPVKSNKEVYQVVKKAAEEVEGKKIGLTTTTQHLHRLGEMKKAVKDAGKEPVTNSGSEFNPEAQVLGCRYKAATEVKDEVDSIIFAGSGKFHPLGIANAVQREVIQANPYTGEVRRIEKGKWRKEKELRKDKARNVKSFAIVNTPYPGQTNPSKGNKLKKKLEDEGKEVYEVRLRQITPSKLDYLPFDGFIINACPRIVLDDWSNYEKPLLLPSEAKELLGF